MIEMTERLSIELGGLEAMVCRLWGGKSPTISETIIRAKALLENSEWSRRAYARESKTPLITASSL